MAVSKTAGLSAKNWALILGSSSGFGGATSIELAKNGFNIFGIHFDRVTTMPLANKVVEKIKAAGGQAVFFNVNAADAKVREKTLDDIKKTISHDKESSIKVIMHSLAFGSLGPYFGVNSDESMTQKKIEMTMDVMANSLVYWTQGAFFRGLLTKGARIFAMTSSGGHSVLPNYGAVSAAKAALESHIRQIAMELGPYGITANAIMAGVTDTPAMRKIPNAQTMLEISMRKNPAGRATTPDDVAKAISLFCDDRASFISGHMIGVDGERTSSTISASARRTI